MREPGTDPVRDELRAAVEARRDLGRDYEDAVVESFLDRLDRSIEARVDARLAERDAAAGAGGGRPPRDPGLPLALWSLGAGIPITAISATQAGLGGLLVSWAGIAAVNVAHNLGRRRR